MTNLIADPCFGGFSGGGSNLHRYRLSTIEHPDRIIVLDHGRVVEEGNHRSLLAAAGAYCLVYNAYFRHQSPDYRPGSGFVPVRTRPLTRAPTGPGDRAGSDRK
jgi:ATP-binding cassette, subfamily B, bacterial